MAGLVKGQSMFRQSIGDRIERSLTLFGKSLRAFSLRAKTVKVRAGHFVTVNGNNIIPGKIAHKIRISDSSSEAAVASPDS